MKSFSHVLFQLLHQLQQELHPHAGTGWLANGNFCSQYLNEPLNVSQLEHMEYGGKSFIFNPHVHWRSTSSTLIWFFTLSGDFLRMTSGPDWLIHGMWLQADPSTNLWWDGCGLATIVGLQMHLHWGGFQLLPPLSLSVWLSHSVCLLLSQELVNI